RTAPVGKPQAMDGRRSSFLSIRTRQKRNPTNYLGKLLEKRTNAVAQASKPVVPQFPIDDVRDPAGLSAWRNPLRPTVKPLFREARARDRRRYPAAAHP